MIPSSNKAFNSRSISISLDCDFLEFIIDSAIVLPTTAPAPNPAKPPCYFDASLIALAVWYCMNVSIFFEAIPIPVCSSIYFPTSSGSEIFSIRISPKATPVVSRIPLFYSISDASNEYVRCCNIWNRNTCSIKEYYLTLSFV